MAANNETGAVQPVAEASQIVHSAGGLLHTDAVQAAGRIKLDMTTLGADMLSLSAHKIGGPKGVGALVLGAGATVEPLSKAAARSGAVAPARRMSLALSALALPLSLPWPISPTLRRRRRSGMAWSRARLPLRRMPMVLSARVARLPNTTCIAVPGAKAETLVIGLDLAGVAVSSGSACSSGKVEASHVLSAMGVAEEVAEGAIRVSLGFAPSVPISKAS